MFFFTRKVQLGKSSFLNNYVDWHSHILPGVDDGIETEEEALNLLSLYEKCGVKELWLTPHIMEDMPNTTQHLKDKFAKLNESYSNYSTQGSRMTLHLASENMVDTLFRERLEKNDFLPIGTRGDMLLLETSYFNPPINLYKTLQEVKAKGYRILLAHPERYQYMSESDYKMLKDMGVLFQMNLLSLSGGYGGVVRTKARDFIKKGWYNHTGSDIHSVRYLEAILNSRIPEKELESISLIN